MISFSDLMSFSFLKRNSKQIKKILIGIRWDVIIKIGKNYAVKYQQIGNKKSYLP